MVSFFEQFFEMMLSERGISRNSLISYKKDLSDFSKFLSDSKISEIEATLVDINNYINVLSLDKKLSARSINRKISTIRTYYHFLCTESYRVDNPALSVDVPRYIINIPTILSIEDMKKLLIYCAQNKSPLGIRYSAMIHLLYSTGMRVSELVSIKLIDLVSGADLSLVRKNIIIKGKGEKERVAIINEKTRYAISEYLLIKNKHFSTSSNKSKLYLFPSNSSSGHISRQNFGLILKKIISSAGIDSKNISPHTIRHSFATHLLAGGANLRVIQELLGHVDINTTQIYTHLCQKTLSNTINSFHPLSKYQTKL